MCGFAGILSPKPVSRELLEKMGGLLAHRGPDEHRILLRPDIGLVHERLSILDLAASHQPMSSPDDRYHIVFNGEIYNFHALREMLIGRGHTFATDGDTEVLLRLYMEEGEGCLEHLRGMFAFAIWDAQEAVLFGARDHCGQKPLFYTEIGDTFVFASEIKAILAALDHAPELDLTTLYHYMGLRFCPENSTLFHGIKKLPPASSFRLRNGRLEVSRYWSLDYTQKLDGRESDLVDRLHDALQESVRLHLVSDVPLGTFLSGGVDSSIVTALAAGLVDRPLPTFSIGSDASDFSELPYAREVATRFKTDQHERIVSPDLIYLIPDLVWHMEEPGDPHGVGIFTLSGFTHEHVKVALGGDGGDEMFAGYTRYRGQHMLQYYSLLPLWIRRHLIAPVTGHLPESFSYLSLASKAKWMNEASYLGRGDRYYHSLVFFRFSDPQKEQLFTDEARGRIEDRDTAGKVTRFFDAPNAATLTDRILYTDTMTRMPEHYLLIADRLSMAFGLEVRVPLVDYKVAELAARIPASWKLNRRRQKHILKLVGERYLERSFLDRTKQGFGYPMGRWFRSTLRPFVANVLESSELVKAGIFRREYVDRVNAEHQAGAVDHSFRIWMLVNCEVWYRMFVLGWARERAREWIAAQRGA